MVPGNTRISLGGIHAPVVHFIPGVTAGVPLINRPRTGGGGKEASQGISEEYKRRIDGEAYRAGVLPSISTHT